MVLTDELVRDSVLEEVGAGRLTVDEALEELEEANIEASPGYFKSLLAFSASAILVENGFTRNGYETSSPHS